MSRVKKTVSASCKAQAILEWTVEDARSIQKQEFLESGHLPFSDAGFGASSLRWNLVFEPNFDVKKENGDPDPPSIFLGLDGGSEEASKVQASFILQVFLPKAGTWETVLKYDKEFDAFDRLSWSHGDELQGCHAEIFGQDSRYISDDGEMTFKAVIDFEIASNPVSHLASAVCTRQADFYYSHSVGDVVLVSSAKREFPVHCAILSAHSSTYRAMFEHDTKDKETVRAEIDDVDAGTLDILLAFIYSGDTSEVKDATEKVLEAADKYGVSDLQDLAEKYLCKGGITLENAYRLSVSADRRNLPKLSQAVSGFIAEYWSSLRKTPEFLQVKEKNGHLFAVLEEVCKKKKTKPPSDGGTQLEGKAA